MELWISIMIKSAKLQIFAESKNLSGNLKNNRLKQPNKNLFNVFILKHQKILN